MKIGMNLLLWTGHVTEAQFPLLEKLKRAGFDGVEVPIFEGDEAHYKKIGQELRRQGMTCTTITVCPPDVNPISKNADQRRGGLDRLKWVLDMSAAAGSDLLC